jgi:hypothetical protein
VDELPMAPLAAALLDEASGLQLPDQFSPCHSLV